MNLHPDFANKHFICDLELCRVLLEDNQKFLWLILVPLVENKKNILDLSDFEYQIFCKEVRYVSDKLNQYKKPDQINIATLGNVTPQLHCHIIMRFKTDTAWPSATFGTKSEKYDIHELNNLIKDLQSIL